jgi:hypothetical protein
MEAFFMNLIEPAKSLLTLALKIPQNEIKIEMQTRILELLTMIGNSEEEKSRLREQIRELKDRVDSQEKVAVLRDQLTHDRNAYWKAGEEPAHPYCMGCHDDKGKIIRLIRLGDAAECPVCQKIYPNVFGETSPSAQIQDDCKWGSDY